MPFCGRKDGTVTDKTENVPHYVIQALSKAEWRNPPRWTKNQHKVKLAAWEDSSTPFHFGRNDMSGGGTIQPPRLYSQRGGRLIAAPTCATPLRPLFLQYGTPYRASSTAYGGPLSPKGKVLGRRIQEIFKKRSQLGCKIGLEMKALSWN